jgi:glycosyltransferase involved in cell wall biosynthesis
MSHPRIAIVSHEYPPFIFGGIGSFTYDLAHTLADKGLNVTVLAGCPHRALKTGGVEATSVEGNLRIVRMPRTSIPPSHLWYQIMNMSVMRSLVSKFDIVHGQDCASYPLIRFCKRQRPRLPWVVTIHTDPVSELHYALQSVISSGATIREFMTYVVGFPFWDSALRGHSKLADALVGVSRETSRAALDCYNVSSQKLHTINTGVDIRRLEDAAGASKLQPTNSHKVRLFYSGRLYWRKGILHLLKSLAHLKSKLGFDAFQLQVIGRGPLEGRITRLVSDFDLGNNIELRGFLDRTKFVGLMASSDIVCVPSLYEACPVAMIEAMALGKAVVAFDKPFSRELFEDIPDAKMATSVSDYAKQLHALCASEYLRERLGKQLRIRAIKKYDMTVIADKYLELYTEVMQGDARGL